MHELGPALWLLPLAFLVHDGEEVATTARWFGENGGAVAARSPFASYLLSGAVTTRVGFAASAAAVALLVLGVSAWAALVPHGVPAFLYASLLAALALHVLGHVAAAVAVRGYAPGVATGALVVWPVGGYLYWRLFAAGVLWPELALWTAFVGAALLLPTLLLAHRVGRAVEARLA